MKYRKKSVVIDAFRWTGCADQKEDPEWLNEKIKDGTCIIDNTGTEKVSLVIKTLHGSVRVRRGDWIIKESADEIFSCRPNTFKMTYEPV